MLLLTQSSGSQNFGLLQARLLLTARTVTVFTQSQYTIDLLCLHALT